MRKNYWLAIYFCVFVTLIIGIAILYSGLNGVFDGSLKWIVGITMIASAIIVGYPLFKKSIIRIKYELKRKTRD